MTPIAKRAPSVREKGFSSNNESALQPRGRRQVIRGAMANEDDSDQPGGAKFPGGSREAREALIDQEGTEQAIYPR